MRKRIGIHEITVEEATDEEEDGVSSTSDIKNFCGVIQTRPEYYTIPPLEELEQYVDEEGHCMVEGFTVGRVGYGNVYFPEKFDVSNLNLDEILHFRHKELTIYPDETIKPPVGTGLNRPAQVTLDRIWPRNKEDGKLITKPDEIMAVNFSENLRKVCDRMSSKFVEYRPDSGSWVFMVDHFSKYGLSDKDELLEEQEIAQNKASCELPSVMEEKQPIPMDDILLNDDSVSMEDVSEMIPEKQVSSVIYFFNSFKLRCLLLCL